MRRIICALLALVLLCSGCAAQGAQTQQITPLPVVPEPAKTALPTQTQHIGEAIPEAERNYYPVSYSDYRRLSGGEYSEKDLGLFAKVLQTFEWKSLAVVLSMFGTQIIDTRVGDLRMCDLTYTEALNGGYAISFPLYEKDLGIAYISMVTGYWEYKTEYLLLFSKQPGKDTYVPLSIITANRDYSPNDPQFRKIRTKVYVVWDKLTDHGPGEEEHSQSWYDVETGLEVYSFHTEGSDYNWMTDGIEASIWETSVSYEPIPLNEEGGYYLGAQATRSFTFEDGSVKAYRCDYRICYDADKNAFYTAFDALLPLYRQAQGSECETIRGWADAGIKRIGELRNPVKEEMPKEDKRFLLSETVSHIRETRVKAEKLTEKQMKSIVAAINDRNASNLGEALGYWGMSKGEFRDLLFGMQLNDKSNVQCTLDMETCRERIVFFHITYTEGRAKRGITLVYLLGAEGDEWAFHTAITYPLYGDAGPAVKYYNPYSCAISVPVTKKNGHPLFETIVIDSGRLSRGLLFVGEYFDREGNKYRLTFYPEKVRGDKLGELYAGTYSDTGSYYIDGVSLNVWDDYPWQGGEAFVGNEDAKEIERFWE